jgi:hypothetical protein
MVGPAACLGDAAPLGVVWQSRGSPKPLPGPAPSAAPLPWPAACSSPSTPPQGRIRHRNANGVEYCYAGNQGSVAVTKSAVYSTGMKPGTASWTFSKSVELAGPYSSSRVVMFNGDAVDATYTLSARKMGTDVNYQGVVSGTISISNPSGAPVVVNSVTDQIVGGPTATVACPRGVPFTVSPCSTVTCQYTAYYPTAPPAGTYSSNAQVQFQVSSACRPAGGGGGARVEGPGAGEGLLCWRRG